MLFCFLAAIGPVAILPQPVMPYAEVTADGVEVDGDFLLRNDGDEDLGIDEFTIEVRNPDGELVQRREWNSNGTSPSIAMLNERTVPAHGQVLLFNPLNRFASGIEIGSMEVIVALSRPEVDERIEARTPLTVKREKPKKFAFPLQGRVLVWDGHDFASHHRRMTLLHPALRKAGITTNAARYSMDLILIDEQGRRSTGDETVNENWFSFGAPVLAEDAGSVVSVSDGAADDRTSDMAHIHVPNALYGNHVIIAHDDGSYSIYGHLKRGSVLVAAGDKVAARQQIGAIGASGSAQFPHLHVQRMAGPTDRSEGVPTHFADVVRPGGAPFPEGYVDSGDVLIAH